jgi:hypothetical protein
MKKRGRAQLVGSILAICLGALASAVEAAPALEYGTSATILVYHRFGPVVADNMTVTTAVFASQLKFLSDHNYTIVPLRDVVNFAAGRGASFRTRSKAPSRSLRRGELS